MDASIERRTLLYMGTVAAAAGAAGIAGFTPNVARADMMPPVEEDADWRSAPDPIDVASIIAEYDADFVVIGMGHAGTCCARYLAEQGMNVIALEAQEQEMYSAYGEDFGHINSQWILGQGVPEVDPVEFHNNWMLNAQYLPNQSLVMKYARNSGECFDWWVEGLGEEFMSHVTVDFWPRNENTISEIAGQKFWNGTPQFIEPGYEMTDVVKRFHELYLQAGGQLFYGTKAEQLVEDGGRVAGVIASQAEGTYVRFNAAKAVVLAGGDFGGNLTMCKELCTSISDVVGEDTMWVHMGRDGSSIRMGLWAGGHLEPRGLPAMGGDTCHPGIINQGMTAVWFNDQGDRFANEFAGDTIWSGRAVFQQNLDCVYSLYDGKLMDQLEYNFPGHNRFDPSDPQEIADLQALLDSVRAASPEPFDTWNGQAFCADTLEEVAELAGMSDEVRARFLAGVERYNELCAEGVDEDFGKDPRVLWAIDTAPFYLVKSPAPMVAFFLVTVGGLVTDGSMRVLDDDEHPIPGLYATGNSCGRRFGSAYFSPCAGVSLGMANTLGRELGKILAGL